MRFPTFARKETVLDPLRHPFLLNQYILQPTPSRPALQHLTFRIKYKKMNKHNPNIRKTLTSPKCPVPNTSSGLRMDVGSPIL